MNSVLYSVASAGVDVVKSALCGYMLARYQFPGRDLLYKIILGTLFIPLALVILPQSFATIPRGIFNAARVDGANFWQSFQLAWPLARPITATVIIFHFLHTWNEFNIPLIFTFSKPELRNLTVGMFAFHGEDSFEWSGFAAGTVISIIPVLIVFLLSQNYFVRGLAERSKNNKISHKNYTKAGFPRWLVSWKSCFSNCLGLDRFRASNCGRYPTCSGPADSTNFLICTGF